MTGQSLLSFMHTMTPVWIVCAAVTLLGMGLVLFERDKHYRLYKRVWLLILGSIVVIFVAFGTLVWLLGGS